MSSVSNWVSFCFLALLILTFVVVASPGLGKGWRNRSSSREADLYGELSISTTTVGLDGFDDDWMLLALGGALCLLLCELCLARSEEDESGLECEIEVELWAPSMRMFVRCNTV